MKFGRPLHLLVRGKLSGGYLSCITSAGHTVRHLVRFLRIWQAHVYLIWPVLDWQVQILLIIVSDCLQGEMYPDKSDVPW